MSYDINIDIIFRKLNRGGEDLTMTNRASSSSEIKLAWQEFVEDGKIGEYTASPQIVESWRRCYNAGVNPYDGTCYHFLNPTELDNLLSRLKDFIDIARPSVKTL